MRIPGRRSRCVLLAFTLQLVGAAAVHAQGAAYSLTGSARIQVGNGFPLPIVLSPIPAGGITVDGVVLQTTGPDPKALTLPAGILDAGPFSTTVVPFGPAQALFQMRTALTVTGPKGGSAMFSAGGRSGPATFTWCPGLTHPASGSVNPSCVDPAMSALAEPRASIRYQAGVQQFGGVSRIGFTGSVSLAKPAGGSSPPCKHVLLGGSDANCVALFSQVAPAPTAVIGGPLLPTNVHSSPAPRAATVRAVELTAAGGVLSAATATLGTIIADTVHGSFGGPWTTGRVTVRAPAVGETFYLQGADHRVDGVGAISLVAGGVSNRRLTLDAANRGWMTWTVSRASVPSGSTAAVLLLTAALLASTLRWLRRSRTGRP